MELSVLFFGDIVGDPGRDAVAELLPGLREEFKPDLILANVENATRGKGVSYEHYKELRKIGIDAMTTGDHIWQSPDIAEHLDNPDVLVTKPANYAGTPGRGYLDLTVVGKKVRVMNFIGRVFTGVHAENPFLLFDELWESLPKADVTIVDFHAEATSEKRAFAEHVNGRAGLVVGSHTHVPTADAQIMSEGTGFISDMGMCGPQDSCLGADKEPIIKNFLTGLPWRYSLATGQCELGAIFCRIDVESGKATHLEHVRRFTQS